ncbi:MAG: polyphosphate kinase 1 [Rhodothermales bacterium]
MADGPLFDRELSWLSFNARVLQEAADPGVPLLERLKFLAIYSSNLDEFFRVRVASLRSLLRLKKKSLASMQTHPAQLLLQIKRTVQNQQMEFGRIYREELLPALAAEGIHVLRPEVLSPEQVAYVRQWYAEHLEAVVKPVVLNEAETPPFIENQAQYLVTSLWPNDTLDWQTHYGLVGLPTDQAPRFIEIDYEVPGHQLLMLDDVLRLNIDRLYPDYEHGDTYAIKLSRDADLYVDDEFEGDLVEKIRKALDKRETGVPTRLLYDALTPYVAVAFLQEHLRLAKEDMVAGGRYHNFRDFFGFPSFGKNDLKFEPKPPHPHPELERATSMFTAVAECDHLIHVPYQKFDYLVQWLNEAVADAEVSAIWMSLYRVGDESAVCEALIAAAEAGKRVTVFVEVKARFDEEPNLTWGDRMEAAGVRVLYSMPDLKVHAKILLIERQEPETPRYYAYFGTGNFNAKTARIYTDMGLFTAEPHLTTELRAVFRFLEEREGEPRFTHLLVAPFNLRERFHEYIDFEMAEAEAGRPAEIIAKMNSLEDPKIIQHLYRASQAGVCIRLIVRGICRLVPGVDGLSEHIEVRSILGQFLEHTRAFLFHHGGERPLYLASADWMTRNLDRRVEVAFPIYDTALRQRIIDHLHLQWADTAKARHINAEQSNPYVDGTPRVEAQEEAYQRLLTATSSLL